MEKVKISIAAARKNANISQVQLAKLLGISAATVNKWEKGESEPNMSQLRTISELSNIPMDNIYLPCDS